MQFYILERTGMPPIRVYGEELARAADEGTGGINKRQHALSLIRSEGGRLLLQVVYRSDWRNDLSHDDVLEADTVAGLADLLEDYDPAECVKGFPPNPDYAEKQAVLLAEVRQRFGRLVTELFRHAGDEFAERIE
jgi:hypothetical protein